MVNVSQAPQLMDGGVVVSSDGQEIGKIGQVYVDNQDQNLINWVTVKTGWFGSSESFVPMDDASVSGDTVTVPYDKAKIKDAPHADDAGEPLSEQQENDLYAYYGLTSGTHAVSTETVTTGTENAAPTREGNAKTDGYLTRSEEQLHVGTEKVQTGRARLRKFVVTEQQSVTVPVSHEEVRVVREPLAPGEAVDGSTIGEDSIEVTLTEERPIVTKEVVGVEKVKLDTTQVTEQREVTEQVRKEQIEMLDETADVVTDDVAGRKVE